MARGTISFAPNTEQGGPRRGRRLATVVLAGEEEYLRFTAAAFAAFNGAGLELTDLPVPFSLRLRPWLLDWAVERFALRVIKRCEPEPAALRRPADDDRGLTAVQ